jgi:hypothetical protein
MAEDGFQARLFRAGTRVPLRHVARGSRVQREAEAKSGFAVLREHPHDERLVAALQPDRMHVDEG